MRPGGGQSQAALLFFRRGHRRRDPELAFDQLAGFHELLSDADRLVSFEDAGERLEHWRPFDQNLGGRIGAGFGHNDVADFQSGQFAG